MSYKYHLKDLREYRCMKQAAFAASIQENLTTYNQYENGKREPKSDFWIKVAETYKVSIDYLMGFCDDPKGTKYGEAFPLSPDEKELVTAWRKADERDRRTISSVLSAYGFSYEPPADRQTDQEKETPA